MDDLPGFGSEPADDEDSGDDFLEARLVQNAILMEIAHALNEHNHHVDPEKGRYRRRSAVTRIEDNVIDLYEQVDVEEARRDR